MIRAIIIEDEPGSRELLGLMLDRHKDDLTVIAACSNPTDGIISIAEHQS